MTAPLEEAVPRRVLVPIDPITVSRKTTEVAVHPVEEEVWGVAEAMEATMEVLAMVPMIKVLLTTATTMGLKIHFIKIPVTVDLNHLLNTEVHPGHQTALVRILETLKVRLKLRLK
jgi:6-phosphofructokinase